MNIGAFLLILAVLTLVGLYLYAPFIGRPRRAQSDEQHDVSVLLAERDRVLSALQELDFDFGLGKIPPEEYPNQRNALVQKGAEILRQLDEVDPRKAAAPTDVGARLAVLSQLQGANSPQRAGSPSEDDLEALIAARHRTRKQKSAGFCPRCGKPVLVSDRFCPACGKALS